MQKHNNIRSSLVDERDKLHKTYKGRVWLHIFENISEDEEYQDFIDYTYNSLGIKELLLAYIIFLPLLSAIVMCIGTSLKILKGF